MANIYKKQIDAFGNPTGQITSSAPEVITSESLTPTAPINLPPAPMPENLSAINAGITASTNYEANPFYKRPEETPEQYMTRTAPMIAQPEAPTSKTDSLKKLLGMDITPEAPVSALDEYKRAFEDTGIIAKQESISNLKKQLASLDAQAQTLNQQAGIIPLQGQEFAEGKGITAGGLAPLTASALRKNAIAMLPITSQRLAVAAQLAGEQGDYNAAVEHINTALDLQFKDNQANIAYKDKLYERAKDIVDDEDKKLLEERQRQDKIKDTEAANFFFLKKDFINMAQSAGDFNTAAKLVQATTEEELNTLSAGMKEVAKVIAKTGASSSNKLTWSEAKSRELPLALVGKSEAEIITELLNPTVPRWFKELMEKQEQQSLMPNIVQSAWDEYRQGVMGDEKTDTSGGGSSSNEDEQLY